MKSCCIEGCSSVLLARGWCRKHYLRWYKHGDPTTVLDPVESAARGEDLPQFKHGLWNHPLYPTWHTMMARCYNAKSKKFTRYGGRGISVTPAWHDVAKFIADMGQKPAGMSLDRIDNDGPYSPENCRWATPTQQARNRPQAILSDKQRLQAIEMYAACKSPKLVAEAIGISASAVKNVVYSEAKRLRTVEKIQGVAR